MTCNLPYHPFVFPRPLPLNHHHCLTLLSLPSCLLSPPTSLHKLTPPVLFGSAFPDCLLFLFSFFCFLFSALFSHLPPFSHLSLTLCLSPSPPFLCSSVCFFSSCTNSYVFLYFSSLLVLLFQLPFSSISLIYLSASSSSCSSCHSYSSPPPPCHAPLRFTFSCRDIEGLKNIHEVTQKRLKIIELKLLFRPSSNVFFSSQDNTSPFMRGIGRGR